MINDDRPIDTRYEREREEMKFSLTITKTEGGFSDADMLKLDLPDGVVRTPEAYALCGSVGEGHVWPVQQSLFRAFNRPLVVSVCDDVLHIEVYNDYRE